MTSIMKPTTKEARAEAVGQAIEDAWNGIGSDGVPNRLPPIDLSNHERRHIGRAAIKAFAADAGSGWRMVPETPTPEMIAAWEDAEPEGGWAGMPRLSDEEANRRLAQAEWTAMLSAAPAPDAKEEG